MAVGWTQDGAVQDQIDASVGDAVAHLTFTADRILDEDGKDALPGYREVGADDANYLLTNDTSGWSSQFSKTSATKMKWVIASPNNSSVTVMTKK